MVSRIRRRRRSWRLSRLRKVGSGCIDKIADESVFEAIAAALLNKFLRGADSQHFARVHQRDAVATLGFVHEVGREEDRDAIVPREVDPRADMQLSRA
jgi:hypothetical protein